MSKTSTLQVIHVVPVTKERAMEYVIKNNIIIIINSNNKYNMQ